MKQIIVAAVIALFAVSITSCGNSKKNPREVEMVVVEVVGFDHHPKNGEMERKMVDSAYRTGDIVKLGYFGSTYKVVRRVK